MNNQITRTGSVSVCSNRSCVHATGKFAEMIATAAVIMLLLIGLGALLKAIK